jgi:hypothetical protein
LLYGKAERPMPEDHPHATPDDAMPGPVADLRRIQARLLAGDADAAQDLERLIYLSNLEASVREVQQLGALREHRFASAWPVLGRLIAAFRSAVAGVAARWLVRAVIEQQTAFNRATASALDEALALNRHLLARIEQLEQRVAELQREPRP